MNEANQEEGDKTELRPKLGPMYRDGEGIRPSLVGRCIFFLYRIKSRRFRALLLSLLRRKEGKLTDIFSQTLRDIFARYHGVEVGMYSFGACFVPDRFPAGTKIGRYCSLAVTAFSEHANHPMNLKSTHAFFFNPALGYVNEDPLTYSSLVIGNDVWMGHNSVVLPSVSFVGDGAVIGAGAVVNKNVAPYAVVVGHPARIVRYRFSKERIEELRRENWWEKTIDELCHQLDEFVTPVEGQRLR